MGTWGNKLCAEKNLTETVGKHNGFENNLIHNFFGMWLLD